MKQQRDHQWGQHVRAPKQRQHNLRSERRELPPHTQTSTNLLWRTLTGALSQNKPPSKCIWENEDLPTMKRESEEQLGPLHASGLWPSHIYSRPNEHDILYMQIFICLWVVFSPKLEVKGPGHQTGVSGQIRKIWCLIWIFLLSSDK